MRFSDKWRKILNSGASYGKMVSGLLWHAAVSPGADGEDYVHITFAKDYSGPMESGRREMFTVSMDIEEFEQMVWRVVDEADRLNFRRDQRAGRKLTDPHVRANDRLNFSFRNLKP